jgi:CRISPR/Cas system-associated protein Cas10 (large subunit of type III CRISPR-Cas system)
MPCEYCGRDLTLIIEDKWCSELCKYAREVYEQGEFVVDLDTRSLIQRIGARKARKYRITYPKAIHFSIDYCEKTSTVQNRPEVSKKKSESENIAQNRPEVILAKRSSMNKHFDEETDAQRILRVEKITKSSRTKDSREKARRSAMIQCL